MLIALAYHKGDHSQAERLASWMTELKAGVGHDLILAHAKGSPALDVSGCGFDSIRRIEINDDIENRWPHSANHVFKKIAKEIQYSKPRPWLWLEPDCVPLSGDCFSAIEQEYRDKCNKQTGKPFLGDVVMPPKVAEPRMSGVAVYPGNMTDWAGEVFYATDVAWDEAAAKQIYPNMARSDLIMHRWKGEGFKSLNEIVLRIPCNVKLYHADKSGSAIAILASARRGGPTEFQDLSDSAGKGTVETAGAERSKETSCGSVGGHANALPPAQSTQPKGGDNNGEKENEQRQRPEAEMLTNGGATFEPEPLPAVVAIAGAGCEIVKEKPSYLKSDYAVQPYEQPWQDRKDSLTCINHLCQLLARFCDTGPHSRAVRVAMDKAGVIKKRGRKSK
jgi:hypothetical protein